MQCLSIEFRHATLNVLSKASFKKPVLHLYFGSDNFQRVSRQGVTLDFKFGNSRIPRFLGISGSQVTCMPISLAPDPIRVQSCVCCLF